MPATPFHFTFDPSVPSQQRQWFNDALSRTRFAVDRGGASVLVKTVVEPSAPGHKDYMCTSTVDGAATIEIREGADDPAAAINAWLPNPTRDLKKFFQECVIHELGHVFFFVHFNDEAAVATLAPMFNRAGTGGDSARAGAVDQWNPLDKPWEDRIQEALAEFFKDVYLDPEQRVFDNRTHWQFNQARFGDWLTMIESYICQAPVIET